HRLFLRCRLKVRDRARANFDDEYRSRQSSGQAAMRRANESHSAVSNYLMRQKITREIALAAILAILTTFLHRAWLIYLILTYIPTKQARYLAMGVAFFLGAIAGFLRLRIYLCAMAIGAGLLIGGTWAAAWAPHDIRTTLLADLQSYLEPFWRELILLTAA